MPDIMSSQSMQRLKATESGLQSQISDLSTSLLNNHPKLKSLRAQLADIKTQIRQETQKILASVEGEAKVAGLRAAELERQSGTLRANSAQAGEDEVGLNALQREANAQRQLLETYLARYREAASRADSNSSPADARIVSRAIEPVDPYFPKVVPIVVVAAVATLVMSAIVIMLAELFSGRALRPVDGSVEPAAPIEQKTQAAAAPKAKRDVKPSMLSAPVEEEPAQEAPAPLEDESEFSSALSPIISRAAGQRSLSRYRRLATMVPRRRFAGPRTCRRRSARGSGRHDRLRLSDRVDGRRPECAGRHRSALRRCRFRRNDPWRP
ncbi:hypothetical protein AJ87_25895 [Rhizobium yanglingense]|nr:hypothetical protein AJ87_25895 [Rhizobium yanglingense]